MCTATTRPLDQARQKGPRLNRCSLDFGMIGDLTGFRIKLAWILAYDLLQQAFGDSAITPQRFSLLELIGCNPGQQQVQLGNALGLSRSAATLAVDFWEDRGCIERRIDRRDRRSFSIFLTDSGARELDRLRDLVAGADALLTSDLTEAETAELLRLLGKIHL